jgi:hypothetical protein
MTMPYFTFRNARYRGSRESEKHLLMNRERLKDFSILFNRSNSANRENSILHSDFISNGNSQNISTISSSDSNSSYDLRCINWFHESIYEIEQKVNTIIQLINDEFVSSDVYTEDFTWNKLDAQNWTWDELDLLDLDFDQLEEYQ